ncbi:glycosyltransferase family 2 protein [Paenibacillus sp. GCM10023250]|uniref:glycosyltransferase family 2 protein n=1 Tax=Paenibacillus sp. GCM10023250 TaxID=3252648 RepID=UPI00360AFB61
MRVMRISCCLMVRNNEATLASALRSVQPYVDETIVLDTGSTDASIGMALEHGASVYELSWPNDFAKARNQLLHYVRHADWVLAIDADETFYWDDQLDFRSWADSLKSSKAIIAFPISHYETKTGQLLAVTHGERFFKPSLFRYEGRIHERLVPADGSTRQQAEMSPYGGFRHTGYSSEHHATKSDRNRELLSIEVQENPLDGKVQRYLSAEHYHIGAYIESLKHANSALRLLGDMETYSRAQAHYYKIMSSIKLQDQIEIDTAIDECVRELPDYADPYGIAAEISYDRRQWKQAFRLYTEWELRVARQTKPMPNHCVSLTKGFKLRKWAAALESPLLVEALRNEVKCMKVAIVVISPELDTDGEELLAHLDERFSQLPHKIGMWSDSYQDASRRTSLLSANRAWSHNLALEGKTMEQAAEVFAEQNGCDIVWFWHANERLEKAVDADDMIAAVAREGAIAVRAFSDRLGARWNETRIRMTSLAESHLGAKLIEASAASEEATSASNAFMRRGGISVTKPLIVAHDRKDDYWAQASQLLPLPRLLLAFACQRYDEVLEAVQPPVKDEAWATIQFYKILACYNLNLLEQASEMIYEALEAGLDEQEQLDFIYLYGKLASNSTIDGMKSEVVALLEQTVLAHPLLETTHVLTNESDWLFLIGELHWQLGKTEQALLSWRHSLECSSYLNENCAFRLAEAIYETHQTEGTENIARAILDTFNVRSAHAQSLLYPVFSYLNMREWAVLFESPQDKLREIADERPKVSIIMPVYNDTEYLFESIHSILCQTYIHLELIIIDDGSDADVASIVNQFHYDNRVIYKRLAANQGLPRALNEGIRVAGGSLMGWTSADNKAHPRWLERMVRAISEDSQASAVFSDYYHIDANGIVIETKRLRGYTLNGLQNGGPSLIWRTGAMARSGTFDETMFGIEDRDFTIRLALSGKMVHLQEPLYYYRIHDKSLSARIDNGSLGGWPALHDKLKRKWLYLSFI